MLAYSVDADPDRYGIYKKKAIKIRVAPSQQEIEMYDGYLSDLRTIRKSCGEAALPP